MASSLIARPARTSQRQVADKHGWESEQALLRTALGQFGLERLTLNVVDRLRSVLPLARDHQIARAHQTL